MDKKFREMLDEEFSEVLNSDRADDALDKAIRVIDVLINYEEKYCPWATNEISALQLVLDALGGHQE